MVPPCTYIENKLAAHHSAHTHTTSLQATSSGEKAQRLPCTRRQGYAETLPKNLKPQVWRSTRPLVGLGDSSESGDDDALRPKAGLADHSRLFLPGPGSRRTSLGPHVPSTSTPPAQELRASCPPARGPSLGRAEEGWHFLAGPRGASLAPGHSDSALTDRHQMLFRAALRSSRSFRFSIDSRKPGRGENVWTSRAPSPRRGVGGRVAMAAGRSESGASRIEGVGKPPRRASLSLRGRADKSRTCPVPRSQPLGCPAGSFNAL